MVALSCYNNAINMEKIYSDYQKSSKSIKASAETIQFLVNYSKAVYFVEHKNMKFVNILN